MAKRKILELSVNFSKFPKLTILFLIFVFSITAQEGTKPEKAQPKADKESSASKQKLPTAKEILEKYVQALGGREAYLKIKTKIAKGEVEFSPLGIKGTIESYTLEPNKSYTKMNLQGLGEFIDVFDGVNSWTVDPITGNRKKEGDELEQTKIEALLHKDIKLESIYSGFEVKGIEKINSSEAYAVVATRGKLPVNIFYFDTKTGLLVAQEGTLVTPQGKMPTKSLISDWREIQGVKVPFQTMLITPQFQMLIKFTSVEFNKEIDPKLFEAPEWVRK
ncbi:MAG: hypothetical protein D6687_07900 [Acidobacteria bacterium]|jgi:hypothetical protein|nr:MAG: hypothetical protein D6687_07900 [Acidobacteriota bacterium]GIU81572.1 MAG: hypothetical protein KatS3mg006_0636 [Pyrinomonadaceae bacterium]